MAFLPCERDVSRDGMFVRARRCHFCCWMSAPLVFFVWGGLFRGVNPVPGVHRLCSAKSMGGDEKSRICY